MGEVLTINVQITGMSGMERKEGNVNMICFAGSSNCRNFQGNIMDGGVDTQVLRADGSGTLSARYLMEGMDCDGKPCKLYVENNGKLDENGNITTIPKILTNSSALKWLETAELSGTVEGAGEGKILIRIYEKRKK